MKTIQEMLQELSQCIVTVSGEFRFRTNWNGGKVPQPDLDVFDPNVPFCIENVGDVPVEFGLYDYVDNIMPFIRNARKNCKISYNLKTWQDYDIASTKNLTIPDVNKITLKNNGDRVYIKADFAIPSRTIDFYTHLIVLNQSKDTKIRARGNIISLNKGSDDKYKTDYLNLTMEEASCFRQLFKECTSLIQAPELPSTEIYLACYYQMFQGCTSLIQAPKLPAMEIGDTESVIGYSGCYEDMFKGCTSLTQAPDLPATRLSFSCYSNMFNGCTGLTQAPALPATKLATGCYEAMFRRCTSLTQAPELPATTLAEYCYNGMFRACKKLNYVKCFATNITATDCVAYWLENVAKPGDFYTPASTNWTSGISGIPTGWTRHDIT